MRKFCEHGIGGFFKCRHGCHSGDPVKDYEEADRDISYFLKRLDAHGMSLPSVVPPFRKEDKP